MSSPGRHLLLGVLLAFAHASSPLQAQDSTIRVTLLGTGTPRPTLERFGPSILIEAGADKLIFDVGRGATQRLAQLNISFAAITGVFLTHLHSDHVVGLPDLWLTGWLLANRTQPLPLWGPPGTTAMATHLEAAFAFDRQIRVADDGAPERGGALAATEATGGIIYDHAGLQVTAFPVDHGLVRPALGYAITYHGRRVVLSGDTRPSGTASSRMPRVPIS
jgi:ribonuclease Z